jgi:hypothetical protein
MSLRNSHQQSNIHTSIPKTFSAGVEPKMQTKFEKMQQKKSLLYGQKLQPLLPVRIMEVVGHSFGDSDNDLTSPVKLNPPQNRFIRRNSEGGDLQRLQYPPT